MMNHLIDSKFYELCDVKRFNDFIMSLKKISDESYHHQYIEYNFISVNELIKIHKPYEDLTKYVENSPSWLKLKQQYSDWENAQEQLKQLKHTSEQVLDEIYPTYLTIYKHTITIPDKDFDDFVIEKTYSFYVKGYCGEVIEDWESLLLPYTNKAYFEEKDLITEACDKIKWLNQQVLSYRMSERVGCKQSDIEKVFNINNLIFKSDGLGITHLVEYDGKTYYDHDFLNLLKDYEHESKIQYIKGDEYVEYPKFKPLLEFRKLLESGEYKQVILI